jgi:hypothetical protein
MGKVECPLEHLQHLGAGGLQMLEVDVENCSCNSLGIHWLQVEGLLRAEQEKEKEKPRQDFDFDFKIIERFSMIFEGNKGIWKPLPSRLIEGKGFGTFVHHNTIAGRCSFLNSRFCSDQKRIAFTIIVWSRTQK